MNKAKVIIIAIACVCLICMGYFFFAQGNVATEKELTDIEKVLVKDLKSDYPKTPREVVKFYNRIIKCYYGETLSEKEIEQMADQMLCLLDEDLLMVNPRTSYLKSVKTDIEEYKSQKKRVVSTDVCDSNDVEYVDDKKEGTDHVDKLAYVNASYFINTNGEFTNTYQQFVLRQDEDGRWKILTFYEVEGESEEDD